MTGRDEIIGRIRAIRGNNAAAAPDLPAFTYHRRAGASRDAIIARFITRLEDYGVTVLRARSDTDIRIVAERQLAGRGVRTLVVPADLPASWRPKNPAPIEDIGLSFAELDTIHGAMTGAFLGIAETGSVVLDGGLGQGRRALTLLPDYHLCVVRESAVQASIPEAIAALYPHAQHGAPITFFSGPSATADIELDRVAGVHGPRTLDIILVA